MIALRMTSLLDPVSKVTASLVEPWMRQWDRDEFMRLAEQGFFNGQRVQLFRGAILQMPPQGLPHSIAIERADLYVRSAFSVGYRFRVQMPFYSADGSEPEPDIAVIAGLSSDYITSHPHVARLIIEVSDTSLRLDRAKASAYAASGVPEYWIVNLVDAAVEVHRDPVLSGTSEMQYQSIQSYARGQSIAPLNLPGLELKVNELIP